MAIKRCTHPFAASIDGQPVVFAADKLFDEEDPLYKGLTTAQQEAFFENASDYTERRMATAKQTETATAAPGEARKRTTKK